MLDEEFAAADAVIFIGDFARFEAPVVRLSSPERLRTSAPTTSLSLTFRLSLSRKARKATAKKSGTILF